MSEVTIRPAGAADDAALAALDHRAWSPHSSPLPRPAPERTFLSESSDVLVAEVDGAIAGYVQLARVFPIEASAHVLQINGLGVDPALRGRGIGRRLVDAAIEEARRRGVRKLSLRVFAPNTVARRLYEAAGFEVEGVLREEFRIGEAWVDDVIMARRVDV